MSTHGRTHWIKLYVEMIDDPKVGILPDAIKWRWVSALLLAGELNEDGFLPDVNDMAWRLHTNVETLQGEMRTIAGRGLVELKEHPDGSERWFIKAFAKRQAPATGTERSRMSRHRARQGSSNDTPDDTQRNVASSLHKQKQNTETVIEGERGRTPIQEPAMYSQAHPAIKAIQSVTSYWPGEVTHDVIIAALGDAPDIDTLRSAYKLWAANGNKLTNYAGICDWYQELRRDPTWTPQARFKGRQPTAAAPDEENIWTRTIAAIKSGKLPADAALAKAIKAVGWSRLQEANQYNERQVREELVREYRNAITAAA